MTILEILGMLFGPTLEQTVFWLGKLLPVALTVLGACFAYRNGKKLYRLMKRGDIS
ncbi:hypothetical protein FACS189425_09730 [Clostridia bacterium]|nr:hypothetical protein FACS189425_09730 [Clostridia bacterium]